MKKAKKRKTVGQSGKKKSLFSIWLGVWIPLFALVLVTIAVLTGLWYSNAEDEIREGFESWIENIFTTDWENGAGPLTEAYREERNKGEKNAEEFVTFTLEGKINLMWSTGIYGVLYDDKGNIITTTNRTVYFGYKDKAKDKTEGEMNRSWYQCKNSRMVEEIFSTLEKYGLDEYDNCKFDEIYVKGRTFLPAKMVILKNNMPIETVSFSLEGEDLSSYTYMEGLLQEAEDGSINAEEAEKTFVGMCGYRDAVGECTWDEAYLEYLKGVKNPKESETYAYYEQGFNEEEAQSYQKITIDGKDYYLFFGKKYHPFTYIKGDVGVAALIGVVFSIVFALILSANFYRIYRKELILQERQREFSTALAHDLKTPMMAISGYTENLAENIHPEKKEHYIEGIQSNISYMNDLVGQILELAKMEHISTLQRQKINLQDTVQKVLNKYVELAGEKEIAVRVSGEAEIFADAGYMERIVENLLKNALDHTPKQQSVSIKMNEKSLEITNTGVEIEKEKVEEMWKPFVKGDKSRSREEGHGLGLAIVREILELHGFEYEMTSEHNAVTVRIFF